MQYHERYLLLKEHFSLSETEIRIDELSTIIHNFRFDSLFPAIASAKAEGIPGNLFPDLTSQRLPENESFIYPVFIAGNSAESKEVILLLHGLNERVWTKYLAWAQYLSEQTGQPVVLFPLAFHMNRSPESWNDPRRMSGVSAARKAVCHDLVDSTYVNAALSVRLEHSPEQFFISGLQSYQDVVRMVSMIGEGRHPMLPLARQVNIFSYSIGAFLAALLFMDNPGGLFERSKLSLFCGGATFDRMNGVSRLILDSRAFQKLQSAAAPGNFRLLKKLLHDHRWPGFRHFWHTLKNMTYMVDGRKERSAVFSKIGSRIYAIGLLRDRIVPAVAMEETFGTRGQGNNARIEIHDFPFAYTHESPFPVGKGEDTLLVDATFNQVFGKFADFLRK